MGEEEPTELPPLVIELSDDSIVSEEYFEYYDDAVHVREWEPCAESPENLLAKRTKSFTCLAQQLVSRSSLLRHPLFRFPPLLDPGIDAAFNLATREDQIDYVGIDKYRTLCRNFGIMVLSRVVKSLPTPELNLRYYGLTHKQMKAISKALRNNVYVRNLDLEENYVDAQTAHYLGEMLRENDTLQVLNLKECRMGPEGAKLISDGILTTQTLIELDLSCNGLGWEGVKNLKDALKDNCTIKRVNLSKNDLGEESVPHLAVVLDDNFALEHLDLSWNRLNSPQAWKQLVNDGLLPNKYLRSLNLSWNAISSRLVMRNLLKYTKETETLEYLDLSNNLIAGELVKMIKALIMRNSTLLGLNLGFNPLTPADAQMLVELLVLPKNTRPKLEDLNMDNVYVKKGFLGYMRRAARLNKRVTIGGVLGNWTIKGPDVPRLLFDRCRQLAAKPKKKKLQRDFSHFIFLLPDKPMTQTAFADLADKFKMKTVDKDLLGGLANLFRFKKKGVDAVAMREKYLEMYPDAKPPPKKQKKRGRRKRKKKRAKLVAEAEAEEAGGDQGEDLGGEFEGWSMEEAGEEEEEEEEEEEGEEDEEEEEEEEEEEQGEEYPGQMPEVAYGESITDIAVELESADEDQVEGEMEKDEGNDDAPAVKPVTSAQSGGFPILEPISEVSEA